MSVNISKGNMKLGNIPSVSLPAGLTCIKNCVCYDRCYARKIERLRPNVHNCYMQNYDLLKQDADRYFREVEGAIMASRFFRWHVSGDIVDEKYLKNMIGIAERNKHCDMLCFTKKYDIVNNYIKSGGLIPSNLHLIFSVWKGLRIDNPYNLPEAHVRYRDKSTTARMSAKQCGGNCTECATSNGGCWALNRGEQIVFNEH